MDKKQRDFDNFVAATDHVPPARPAPSALKAGARENALAGFGAACLLAVLCLVGWGALYQLAVVNDPWPDPGRLALAAALAGVGTFGALSFIRFGMDELSTGWNYLRYKIERDRAVRELVEERRLRKLAETQLAVQTNRAGAGKQPAPALGDEYRDAYHLIVRHFNGLGWQRDRVVNADYTPTRWKAAMTVLVAAGVAVPTKNSGYKLWDERATAPDAINAYRRHCEAVAVALGRRVGGSSDDPAHVVTTPDDGPWGRGVV